MPRGVPKAGHRNMAGRPGKAGNYRVGTAPKKSIVGKMMKSKKAPIRKVGNKVADSSWGFKRTVGTKQAANLASKGRKIRKSGGK